MADEANTYESEKKEQLNCRKNNFTKNPRSAKFAKLSKQEGIDEEVSFIVFSKIYSFSKF